MSGWLIGIGAAGFVVGLFLCGMARLDERRSRVDAVPRGWAGCLAIAGAAAVLAVLFAWPAWHLGRFVGPPYEVSETTGGALFACIFGLGGAALAWAAAATRSPGD